MIFFINSSIFKHPAIFSLPSFHVSKSWRVLGLIDSHPPGFMEEEEELGQKSHPSTWEWEREEDTSLSHV